MRQPFHKQDLNSQFIAVFWNLLLFWNRAFKIDLGILFSGAAKQVKQVKQLLHQNSEVLLQRNA